MYITCPLADFLIEKSLENPKLIGITFYWNAMVNQNNILFKERLSVIMCNLLMISGPEFLENIQMSYKTNENLRMICNEAKRLYRVTVKEKTPVTLSYITSELEDKQKNGFINFTFPIHPSFKNVGFCFEKCKIFASKMVPMVVMCKSTDGGVFPVIFKVGDDLRQDVLTLQILKIMDKMWLENDLDLKILTYKVQPTGVKEGLIEFVIGGNVIGGLQSKEGVGGSLDKELLINFLNKAAQPDSTSKKAKYETYKQYDNFIRSLAGFCVATCVLGIGDRHPRNVMIKSNGIFFHIDYGHFLGNFKSKFGIQRERAPFLLTPEMAHVYIKAKREDNFKSYCVKAYNILRRNANRLINLFIIMSSAGI